MPGWLRQSLTTLANDIADEAVEKITEQIGTQIGDAELSPVLENLKECGLKTNTLSSETTELCVQTLNKSTTMLELASDIRSTLQSCDGSSLGASKLDMIRDLLSGDKLSTAMGLAESMSQDALECVNKSVEMMTTMEKSLDDLPEPLQLAIDTAMSTSSNGGEARPSGVTGSATNSVEQDVEDVQRCILSIRQLNLMTAMEVGLGAFESLTNKAEVTRDMLSNMKSYSTNVRDITGAFSDLQIRKIVASVKDIWKCLRMTGVMRELAEGLGKLLQVVVHLFQETSTRISGLWQALAFAKDCMSDVSSQVEQVKALCGTAQDKSVTLINATRSIKDQLEDMGELNASSVSAFRELSDGEEIRSSVQLAQEMDDQVLRCVDNVVGMIDRVSEGVKSLPPIITDDIPEDAGKRDDDPVVPDVQSDIQDLEHSRQAIEDANLVLAVKEGSRGFSGVADKVTICKDMLGVLQTFADSCISAIQSFLGVWDLQTAIEKIKGMFRIVNLGELMKQFANQIKHLILAAIALMKAAIDKFSDVDLSDFAGSLKESIGGAIDQAANLVEDLNLKKLRFWKK